MCVGRARDGKREGEAAGRRYGEVGGGGGGVAEREAFQFQPPTQARLWRLGGEVFLIDF